MLMNGQVWFGTKGNMQWIPAPAVDMQAGKAGYAGRADFLGGGTWVRRSKAASKTYSMSWNLQHRDDIQPVLDYADGMYGDGPIYWADPFAMDRNMLPAYWAAPYINAYDGPVILDDTRPTLVNNTTSSNGYPVESATYRVTSTSNKPSIFVPIPPGYVAHVGAHGTLVSGNASVTVMSHSTAAGGPTSNLTLLSRDSSTRTNYTASSADYLGVTISLGSASTGVIRLDGLIVQVLPLGRSVPSGGFISGQGTSGMSFVNQPTVSAYSAALDRVGVSADLVETEAWS